VRFIETGALSQRLTRSRYPAVIISASGMATGGRVLHHLVQYLGHHRNMVVLTGYQAPGTRGASLADGATKLRIHGHDVPVRAEVVQMKSASAHADASQLMDWLRALPAAPRRVFVTHGEMGASDALRHRIQAELRWQALVPEHGSVHAVPLAPQRATPPSEQHLPQGQAGSAAAAE